MGLIVVAGGSLGQIWGMDRVVTEVLPAQKLEVVRAEQAVGRTVMMVGDGVNDAPAIGGADVGVAIGAELNEVIELSSDALSPMSFSLDAIALSIRPWRM